MNMKKLFLLNLPYLLFVYPFDKLAQAFRLAPGADLSGKLLSIGDGFTAALSSPWLSFHPTDLLIGINSNETNGFSYDDGVIDVEPIRDEDGTLTGLKQSSDADFNARTKEQEALKAELEKAGITAGSGSFEQGDPNYRDDSLDAYTEFGVSYDKTSNHWMYGEKPIYILYDKEHYTFCDKGVSDGVSLNVVRDKAGNIEKLVSVDKGELEQFVK